MSDDENRAEFTAWVFLEDGTHVPIERWATAERAITIAARAIRAQRLLVDPAAKEYAAARIIVTDGGDHTVFEWKRGEGVTFP